MKTKNLYAALIVSVNVLLGLTTSCSTDGSGGSNYEPETPKVEETVSQPGSSASELWKASQEDIERYIRLQEAENNVVYDDYILVHYSKSQNGRQANTTYQSIDGKTVIRVIGATNMKQGLQRTGVSSGDIEKWGFTEFYGDNKDITKQSGMFTVYRRLCVDMENADIELASDVNGNNTVTVITTTVKVDEYATSENWYFMICFPISVYAGEKDVTTKISYFHPLVGITVSDWSGVDQSVEITQGLEGTF